MDDLQNYRMKIGTFSSNQVRGGRHRNYSKQLSTFFFYSLIMVVTTGLILEMVINDPSIELNPGPLAFQSAEERSIVNRIKATNKDIANCCSHRFFLVSCKDLHIAPRSIDIKVQLAAAKPTPELNKRIQDITKANTALVINTIIEHYSQLIPELSSIVAELYGQLAQISDPSRTLFLKDHLKSVYTEYVNTLQNNKIRKINTYLNLADSNHIPDTWIPQLGLTETEKRFLYNNEQLCDNIVNAAMKLIMRDNPLLHIQSSTLDSKFLVHSPLETLHIHHNRRGHFVTTTSIGGIVKLYDSLNLPPTTELLEQIAAIYSPDQNVIPVVKQCTIQHEQQGGVDCGLFAIAYAVDLALGTDPCGHSYDQSNMRDHLLHCLGNRDISRFHSYRTHLTPNKYIDVTSHIKDTDKWSNPKKTSYSNHSPKSPTIQLSNRFSTLVDNMDDTNLADTPGAQTTNYSPCSVHQQQHNGIGKNIPPRTSNLDSKQNKYRISNQQRNNKPNNPIRDYSLNSKIIINLTNPLRPLTKEEAEVLELGLSFSPSIQHFNKEKLTEDFYWFIRRLKLTEYFHNATADNKSSLSSATFSTSSDGEEEVSNNIWKEKNPDWYPDKVRNNRSQTLMDFIDNILRDTKNLIENNQYKFWNNLDNNKRQAIVTLANDPTIVIKPSDKCGSIVIMSTPDYEQACLSQLTDSNFYEEVHEDPNSMYAQNVAGIVTNLFKEGHINEFQYQKLTSCTRTPIFYGMPKMHKAYTNFPTLRPICSGTDSCTSKLSEYIDTFLKPAAQKTLSYVRDTTHFILRIKDIVIAPLPIDNENKNIYLSTMDVCALYPNIDHEEGASACHHYMEQRKWPKVTSAVIKQLILLVLKSNTMNFLGRLFHQIKGTAMGSSMAVNFANLFMSKFEQEILDEYHSKTGYKPEIWLRFVDDIFFIWKGDEQSLKHFLQFCNNYSEAHNMKSFIKFTYVYSTKSVNFLDTTISINQDGSLTTELYSKPTAAYQYLHQSSYHEPHLIKAIPKSQFIRIRRICSSLVKYHYHVGKFISHFVKRGYKYKYLKLLAEEVAMTNRETYLNPKPNISSDRIPIVVTYHHKLRGISQVIYNNYTKMIANDRTMMATFSEPPLVSYRRNKNIKDKLIRAKHWNKQSNTINNVPKTLATIQSNMNTTDIIHNKQNRRQCQIVGGSPTDKNVIYAAECTNHNLIYVGMTSDQLNHRFNRHRSDIIHYPYRCELPKHFKIHGCDFNKDLKVSILEKVKGGKATLLRQEDKWIMRMDTVAPNGLNSAVSEFGTIHKALFSNK